MIWHDYQMTSGYAPVSFGLFADDVPVASDYDGDRKADLAVYRPESNSPANTFFIQKSFNNMQIAVPFGTSATDEIVHGDSDGDEATDFAVWRPNAVQSDAGVFYVQKSSTGFIAFGWGNSTRKVPANSVNSQ